MIRKRQYSIRIGKNSSYQQMIALVFVHLFFVIAAKAQVAPDSIPGVTVQGERPDFVRFEYGMNIGFYIANPSTANFYNGSGENNLEEALFRTHNYNAIREDIGYDFQLNGLPQEMKYSPAILIGFFGVINLNARVGFIADFNYARLKTEDQFTLLINRYSYIEGDNIELYNIWGIEERVDLRFAFRYIFYSPERYIHPFLETGISITDTKVKENRARIYTNTISIRNPQNTFYHQQDYGLGLGGFATIGLRMHVKDNFALTLGYSLNHSRINLGENNDFASQHSVFLRLNLNNLI